MKTLKQNVKIWKNKGKSYLKKFVEMHGLIGEKIPKSMENDVSKRAEDFNSLNNLLTKCDCDARINNLPIRNTNAYALREKLKGYKCKQKVC